MALSNKKQRNAREYGQAVGERFIKDFMKHPEWFPKGLDSLPSLAAGTAEVGVYTSCTWECSTEEEKIAAARAREVVNLFLDFGDMIRKRARLVV